MLKPLTVKHNNLYRAARNDDKVRKWCRQVGYISQEQQDNWFEKQEADTSIQMFEYWSDQACNPQGVVGLTSIDMVSRRAEFSAYIFPQYHGDGLGKKAITELFNFGFNELGLHLIWGESFEGNKAVNIFKKFGMHQDGVRRDFYFKEGKHIDAILFSITEKEWAVSHGLAQVNKCNPLYNECAV